MADDASVQLIVSAFRDETGAQQALDQLKDAIKKDQGRIESAAVLRKGEDGQVRITQTVDFGGKKGAALGGVAGAAIGLIAGPALLVPAGVGALIGGLAGKLRDAGFSDEHLERLGRSLTPGSSAIVAVVEHEWGGSIRESMTEAGADTVTEALARDIAEQLEAGGESVHSDGGEAALGEDEVEGARFVATRFGYEVHPEEGEDASG
jgi:uncharacterized membrane protein